MLFKKNFKIYENKRDNKEHFVFHGSSISREGIKNIIKRIESNT